MSTPNFAGMSNDQLRQQMEDYGMPNVPVTASTRNILIKRLQNHVNGGAAAAASTGKPSTPGNKGRRETMHVVKYSSEEDSDREAAKEKLKKKMENHKNARRQTIGGAALSPAPAPAPVPVLEKPSRKSMRATPTKTTRESGIPQPAKNVIRTATIPVTIEDSDEEEIIPAGRRGIADRRSKSKTPVTLGKSDLVTTSYKQVVAPVREEEPIELDDEEEEQNSDLEEDVPLATRFSPRKYAVNEPPTKTYSPVKPMSIRISPLRNTTGTYRYESATSNPTTYSSSYTRPSLATTSYTSRYTTGGEGRAAAGGGSSNGGDGEEEFPYLREFSKRLSTLKAEPLYKRNTAGPLSASSTTRTSTSYSTSRSSNYRPIIQRETHWYDPIVQFLARLEDKYKLKNKILILLALLVVIFLVVMFWY